MQQNMIKRFASLFCSCDKNNQVFNYLVLPFKITKGKWSQLFFRKLRLEWFVDWQDFARHFFGAILMGIGGVLALGCTFGQGITGMSTLALGSIVTLISIIAGSAATMKYEFYLMMREDA